MIPVIDFAPFLRPDASAEDRLRVAQEIGRACEEVGFFVICGHGIPSDVIENIWQSTREFFDLSEEEKLRYVYPQEEYPFGYNPMGSEVLSSGKAAEGAANSDQFAGQPPDLKEMFSLGPSSPQSGFPARRFPENPTSFESAWTIYYEQLNGLARHILHAFALALQLDDAHFFERFIDHHASALRAINYPSLSSSDRILEGQLRASAHTDYGTITILRADGPGLQVSKDKDPPVWHDVPYVPEGFIINLGDLMKRWTNDQWLSTLHRVVIPSTDVEAGVRCRRRQSLAFFHNLNRDAVVEVITRSEDEEKKYEPIVAGDFLLQKHLASMRGKK